MFIFHKTFPQTTFVQLTMACLLTTAIPLWFYDFLYLRVHQRPSTGLAQKPGKVDRHRLVVKLIGLYGTFLIILIVYHLILGYHISIHAPFYNSFFYFLNFTAPWIMILSFIYFREVDRRQKDPYDEYWHMGCLLTGRFQNVRMLFIKEHARVWFIKAFFTPFMFAMLVDRVEYLLAFDWKHQSSFFIPLYNYLLTLFYTIYILYGVLGYILTCRLLDTHIRSTEPTFLGWVVCLVCYQPFYSHFGIGLLNYDDHLNWYHWFAFFPGFYYLCGALIIFLSLVYCLATVAIGYRMSNLTFRGIITSGPYRFTKHPAYLSKVASWWLISLPFLSVEGVGIAFHHTLNLSLITFIYYLRARTEENNLSNYSEYVQYANGIKEQGLFRFITKHFPALQYSEEKCKRWKSVVWFKSKNFTLTKS